MSETEILWTSGFINERLPAPISPLGWSHLAPFIEELALREPLRFLGYPHANTLPLTRLWRGHPYANARAFHIIYRIFPDAILPEDAYRYFPDGAVALRRTAPYPRWFDLPRVAWSLARAFLTDPFNVSPLHNYHHWAHFTHEHDSRIGTLRARINALRDAPPEIFAALDQVELLHRDVLRIHRWSLIDADLTVGLLKWLVRAWVDRARADEITAQLIAHMPNKTLEADADLRQLPREEFLAKHGHRSFSLDIAAPTFADEPTQLDRLQGLANAESPGQSADENNLARSAIGQLAFWQRGLFNSTLFLARQYNGLREDQRYYWQKSLALARQLYLRLADRLIAQNVIAERAAIFYATHRELADYFANKLSASELAQRIAARQSEWREYAREFEASPTASYPAFLRGDTPVGDVRHPVVNEWRGRAISPGKARGVARVVHSPEELARVQAGDVLIAPATDPAWTPVFARLAGLVVERGGVLSHSAVVAREYRVPGVAGIPGIVDAIRDGAMVEVDGNTGTVRKE